jgi:hypothetical protein
MCPHVSVVSDADNDAGYCDADNDAGYCDADNDDVLL